MYRDYLRTAPTLAGSRHRVTHTVETRPSGYLYVPIADTMPVQQLQLKPVLWQHPTYFEQPDEEDEVPHRQPYLDQQDSFIYPSELQRMPPPSLLLSQGSQGHLTTSNFTFSPQLHNSRTEEIHLLERTSVEERRGTQYLQEEQGESRDSMEERMFRKRLESADRKLEWLEEGTYQLTHSQSRDYLR